MHQRGRLLIQSPHAPATTHELVAALERYLGDLDDGEFSYSRRVAADEQEQFPEAALLMLDAWGMQRHYIPAAYGGALTDLEQLSALIRVVARRDLTVAIGHAVSFLGAMTVWIGGSDRQKRTLATHVSEGARVSLALTEKATGSDLLSIAVHAHRDSSGYVINGEKWLINGVTRNRFVTVLARTRADSGPRSLSLLLFDKSEICDSTFTAMSKVRTLGVRGGDIAGIRFSGARVSLDARISEEGRGFELTMQGLQLSRLLCGALSLGAMDAGFRIVTDFILARHLYGRDAFAIPQTRRLLVDAWIDLSICDCLTTAATRAVQMRPEEGAVHSAVVKYLVPTLSEHVLRQLSIVFGARYYLREGHAAGFFQKILRDNALIGLFDGSTMVNLYSLTAQLQRLGVSLERSLAAPCSGVSAPVRNFSASNSPFAWDRLVLLGSGENLLVNALPARIEYLLAQGDIADELKNILRRSLALVRTTVSALTAMHALPVHRVPPRAFVYARLYCAIEALAAVLQLWDGNAESIGGDFERADWAMLVCARLNNLLGGPEDVDDSVYERLGDALGERLRNNLPSSPYLH